jgi:hypothetical protein
MQETEIHNGYHLSNPVNLTNGFSPVYRMLRSAPESSSLDPAGLPTGPPRVEATSLGVSAYTLHTTQLQLYTQGGAAHKQSY